MADPTRRTGPAGDGAGANLQGSGSGPILPQRSDNRRTDALAVSAVPAILAPGWRCPQCGHGLDTHTRHVPEWDHRPTRTSPPAADDYTTWRCPVDGLTRAEHPHVWPPPLPYVSERLQVPPSPPSIHAPALRRPPTPTGLARAADAVEQHLREQGLWSDLSRAAMRQAYTRRRREAREQRRWAA